MKSDYAYAYNNRASAYIKMEEWDKAIPDCTKAIELDKNYAYAYYNRAIAREMKRDVNGACEDWVIAGQLGLDAANTFHSSVCNRKF